MSCLLNIVYVIGMISVQWMNSESYLISSSHIDPVNGRSAFAYSNEIEVRCFSNDSKVLLSNGEEKFLFNLKSSDQILTWDQSEQIHFTEMIMMLDQHPSLAVLFYVIQLKSGHELSLTRFHLIPKRSWNGDVIFIPAEEIRLGDTLFLSQDGRLNVSLVEKIELKMKKGFYAPLTTDGTFFVNHILVSCFSNIKSHSLGQLSMFPFRFFYRLFQLISFPNIFDQMKNNEDEQIPWIIRIYFHLTFVCFPQFFLF